MAVFMAIVQIHPKDASNGTNDGHSKGGCCQHQFNLQASRTGQAIA